ncbi:hypothetical protein Z517_03660 [Fonsecaea pedrosoi CBS 271.37]|uniref:Uncharacterized protein n=1 Tax=Fonsecaea pedrosoi CBS 271.37 TaxID=1442368 RepID=A0A0D2H0L9_9EURO|nr:uncharacterized protein Z517_03660 [Fonsecaea pedrosoi CBS 271.37]KIW84410.1 hypothetical protein Z517_03660 [Fonsecaea pedrosoi CBS 271.37]
MDCAVLEGNQSATRGGLIVDAFPVAKWTARLSEDEGLNSLACQGPPLTKVPSPSKKLFDEWNLPQLYKALSTLYNTHRLVLPKVLDTTLSQQQTPARTNSTEGGPTLRGAEVELYINGFRLKQGLTLNCEELWHVEREVDVAVLGEVTASSFKEVVAHVKQLFCDSLEQAVKEVETLFPAPASSTTKSKTNSPVKARKHTGSERKKRTVW